jgi:hypothetical protein
MMQSVLTALLPALLATLAYLYAFFALYVLTMGVYRAQLLGRLSWRLTPVAWTLALPFALLGVLVDVVAQYTLATLIFCDWPARHERLVTARLQRYVATGCGWRCSVAVWLCNSVLDIFDPEGEHC